jgi:hypothetical protein
MNFQQTPFTDQGAADNLPQNPGHSIDGQTEGGHALHVPDEQTENAHALRVPEEQIEGGHALHVPDEPTEGGHGLLVPDVNHDDSAPHLPDTADDGQPGPGYQSAAPQVNRPPRNRKMPSRYEDYILHPITANLNNYNVTSCQQQSFSDFPGEEIKNYITVICNDCIYFRTFY